MRFQGPGRISMKIQCIFEINWLAISSEMINGEGPVEDNFQLYSDDESVTLYSKIVSLIDFMKTQVDEHRHNIQQLKAMEKSLKKAFTYRDVVTKYIHSNKIQRTWGDWNE